MRTILKSLIAASLLLASMTAFGQNQTIVQDLETWMGSLISRAIDNKVEVSKSLGQERDVRKEGNPLKWRCDIFSFTLPKKQRPLLDEMIKAFEANGHDNPNCYGINSQTTGNFPRRLMIGDDPNRYVTIGEEYENYVNVNILDATDTTKTRRYAYALEWSEAAKGQVNVRYIVTYAKIPSVSTTAMLAGPRNLDIFAANSTALKEAKERLEKEFATNPSALKEAKERLEKAKERLEKEKEGLAKGMSRIDSIHIKYDDLKPYMNFDKWLPRDSVSLINQTLNNGNFLLNFYNLRKYYLEHQEAGLTAISIYNLCVLGNKYGSFRNPDSAEELNQLKSDLSALIDVAKNETDRKFFRMALEQLEIIK